jgi:L-seryl-tRNA(Ser) seleniumtransferase
VNTPNEYRKLPSVDELIRDERAAPLMAAHSRKVVTDGVRKALTVAREAIAKGDSAPEIDALLASAAHHIASNSSMSLRRAINATGIIIHTGLGRAVLSEAARRAVDEVAGGHSTLEIDAESGKRGSRQDHVAKLLTDITGAESALVVNNNAAAVMLAVNTLARDSDVVISRGQLVEIGGSFRLPDIIERAGARLVEVGTTNRTRISDYEQVVNQWDTGLILRCHPSNFKISGFTEEASLDELVGLGDEAGAPVLDDLGSGAFVDLSPYGLEHEPMVQESVKAGAGVVTFSGDKLLGASQAGILVGKAEYIDKCRANPLARALRVDKLTLAALEATLHIYRDGDPLLDIPVLAAISRPLSDVEAQARKLARRINALGIEGLNASVISTMSETGGGSLPGQNIESRAVALKSERLSAEDLGRRFRECEPPIFGRIARDTFLLDMRTVDPKEVGDILARIMHVPHNPGLGEHYSRSS